MTWDLKRHASFPGVEGPLVLVVLDGVGIGRGDESDAVKMAATPTLDRLSVPGSRRTLRAHGRAVGLPSDKDMGNSEVGHNAMGCGRVYDQGALLVNQAIERASIYDGAVWKQLVARCAENQSALHLIGLLSDGNVHSHIDQLTALMRRAASDGIKKIYLHALLDGRDVAPTSALIYIDQIETVLAEISASGVTARIASGGGRMLTTMDRYEADWSIVERGWNAHVHGNARRFSSAREAVETFRGEDSQVGDQYLPAFVIADRSDKADSADGADGAEPVGRIVSGDSVVCFNFRGDRVIEISRAFEDDELAHFDRGDRPDVLYAGIMEYDGDTHTPRNYLVEPPDIDRTMGEFLVRNQVSQLAISETQKYGHVTYFWNGNRSGKFDDAFETYIEIGSDRVSFDERPWMKAAEITDRLLKELHTGEYRFARVNYANGDMVGHTGHFDATVVAIEVLDLQLARLAAEVGKMAGALVITADHGNADEMFMHGKDGRVVRKAGSGEPMIKTSHTLNPVPFIVYDPRQSDLYTVESSVSSSSEDAGVASVTATCLELLGFCPPDGLAPSLLRFK